MPDSALSAPTADLKVQPTAELPPDEPIDSSGPSKGLRETALLSEDERLAGRPKLCSDCGLCDSHLKPRMRDTGVFVRNRTEEIEQRLFGRNRRDGDELRFGVYRRMQIARMRPPGPGAQWSGMVTPSDRKVVD